MLTFLQMVQQAEAELGLPQDTTLQAGSTSSTGAQCAALANRVLDELRRMNRWTALQFEFNLVVQVPIITTGDMAAESAVITNIPSTTGIQEGNFMVAGNAIPAAARVLSVDSPNQVTMTMETASTLPVTGQLLTFARDTYNMPSGFDWFNNRTMWDRTNRWELLGPDSPQMDQWHRSGIVVTGPRRHFRQLAAAPGHSSTFRLWPPPIEITAPLQIVFEYLSIDAVYPHGNNNSTAQYFVNDDDVPLLDDQAIIQGIKWLFWEAKGFGSYVTMQSRWVDYVNRLIARDGAAPTLQVHKRQNPIFISPANVQDGFFPGPIGPNSS